MKYLLIIITVVMVLLGTHFVKAQTISPTEEVLSITPTDKDTPLQIGEKQIQNIKAKIADTVSEMRKNNNKAVAGVISSIKDKTYTITTPEKVQYDVKVDESLTKIYAIAGVDKKELKLDDLKKNDYIIVAGPLVEKVVTANSIYRDEQFFEDSGKVTVADATSDTIKVLTTNKEEMTLDITDTTKMQLIDSKTIELLTATIAKIKEGDSIHFVYKKTGLEKEKNRYDAYRLLIIPQEYFSQ